MKEDITEEEIKRLYDNAVELPFDKIFADLKKGKLPNIEPMILNNGYGVGMSLDYDEKNNRKIKHIYISNPNGKIDPAIADTLATRILGKDCIFIDPMSKNNLFHYMKDHI